MIEISVIETIATYILAIAAIILAVFAFSWVVYFCADTLLPSIPFVRRFLDSLPHYDEEEVVERDADTERRERIAGYKEELLHKKNRRHGKAA